MIDQKRIKEAEKNFKNYLTEGLISKERNDTALKMAAYFNKLGLTSEFIEDRPVLEDM